ncbi:unnamed protein product [Acanthoscelides obtectus]|nr:unnamed protein product [Acanthoscelides obtectus]CAK1673715.1 hypothetical protein AOBTE_LOCUS29421 [Acanthoscelides obtectus]
MVDNLLKVFERATEKYLDQITSSDDEIAIDFSNVEIERGSTTKSEESTRKRKPMLAAQTDKKRDRSSSRDSLARSKTGSVESLDNISVKSKKSEKASKKQKNKNNKTKKNKVSPKKESKKEKYEIKEKEKKAKHESKKEKEKQKEGKKSKGRKSKSNKSNKEKKKEVAHKSPSRCRSSSQSPTRSNVSSPPASWPPSSPESRFDFTPHRTSKKRHSQEMSDTEESPPKEKLKKSGGHKHVTDSSEVLASPNSKQKGDNDLLLTPHSLSPKPKDKHNKLRETIEKLKAKSEMKLKDEFNFELDLPKENKDKPKKVEKEEKNKQKKKDKSLKPKKDEEVDLETNSTMDSVLSEGKKSKKNSGVSAVPSAGGGVQKIAAPVAPVPLNKSLPNLDALSMATEQTLKDINKWLDDTPKFSEFNSASNSPSYTGLDDFETLIGAKVETSQTKKVEKPPTGAPTVKKEGTKDNKKRSFRDPSKLFKRREVQRTIDRLQPGKSKGNLISNVQSTNKTDEMFPLGPLSKIKDTKNSLIVKTDSNAPKLSLGSVLDSFGKHKFVDDQKKEDADQERPTTPKSDPTSEVKISDPEVNEKQQTESVVIEATEAKSEPNEKEPQVVKDSSPIGGATPNLSAWFRAFGAPKMAAPIKKTDLKPDGKENEKCEDISTKSMEGRKVTLPLASPNTDMPLHGQPVPRQRKISTGSSMSERSSFSQDMDSPRVGMDERGAYPAPYPSPLHRSPSGASPIMASPRPDISPKAYPTINGQIRVGFYQDTVSNKSSPDKSCSPRETPQSPYGHYSEHVYTPNTTGSSHYSHPNSPHYSQAPVYSNTNPTPPYNLESYYDTSKSLADQYQSKSHNYSANSPASSHSSPASHPHQSQHSPTVGCSPLVVASSPATPATPATPAPHSPRPSPTAYQQTPNSPLVVPQDSPAVHSQGPSPEVHSPASVQPASLITQPQQSPSVHSQHSADSQDLDAYPQQHQDIRAKSPPMQIQQVNQTPMFPVKKRMYSDNEMPGHQYDTQQQTNQSKSQVETKDYTQPTPEPQSQPAQMEHLSKTSYAQSPILHQEVIGTKSPYPQGLTTNVPVTSQYATPFSGDSGYPLNIPSTRNIASQQTKIDLSKYTNMGYTGPDINYTRSLQQLAQQTQTTINSMISQKPASVASTTISQASNVARYGNPLQQMTSQRAHSNFGANLDRLAQVQDVPSGYKPDAVAKSSYGGNTAGMTMEQQLALGASRELAHIVDRLSGEERLMAGLQTSSSFYTDKGLGTTGSHMFNKPISTSASALPIFSQSGGMVAGMQSYGQAGQSTATTMYNRQMAELMQQQQQQQQQQNEQQKVVQEKKSKRKKSNKSATSATSTNQQQQLSTSAQQQAQQQGFQSYAGLKGHPAASAEAIALKTSSVVPGSAFNFGPTTAGLAGLYAAAEKDAYPNFLDEFRAAAPNYYMAAAQAARHRSTPDKVPADKQQQSRTAVAAHQSSTGQPSASAAASYPSFLGATPAHHQPTRPAYPPTIGSPFISNAQAAQLMDTSSPLYQQYIQAGLLNQGLLGPPGAYPPGYHPALSLRQPYDSMTRPSWL